MNRALSGTFGVISSSVRCCKAFGLAVLLFLALYLGVSSKVQATEGVFIDSVTSSPSVPAYLAESVREMVITEMVSSPRFDVCLQPVEHGEKTCNWELKGSLSRGDEGLLLEVMLLDNTSEEVKDTISLMAEDEAALPVTISNLPAKVWDAIHSLGRGAQEPPPAVALPVGKAHPDRLLASKTGGMEDERGSARVGERTAAVQGPAPSDEEDESAFVPDYPVEAEQPVPAVTNGKAETAVDGDSIIKWPLGFFHKSNPQKRRSVTSAVPLYPTPDEVFAKSEGEGDDSTVGEALTPVEATGGAVPIAPSKNTAISPVPPSPPTQAGEGPRWQWY